MLSVLFSGNKEGERKNYDFHWSPGVISNDINFPYMISGVQFRSSFNYNDWERILEVDTQKEIKDFKNTEYKYITFELEDESKRLFMVLFNHDIYHSDFIDVVEELCFETGFDYEVKSAGFCNVTDQSCFGLSESIGVSSNPEVDNKLLQKIISNL